MWTVAEPTVAGISEKANDARIMEFAPGIHLLEYPLDSLWTGIFVLVRKKVVVIDTAFEPAMERLLYPFLAKIGLRPGDIDLVINTHIHGDHIGGNGRLHRETKAKFAAHRLGAEKLSNPYYYLNLIRSRFYPLVPYQEITTGLTPQKIDIELEDNQEIDLGDSALRVVHTPGHSSESISLLDTSSGVLFTGDSLQGRGTLSTGVGYYPNLSSYRMTLSRVGALFSSGQIKRLAPGHPFDPIEGVLAAEEGDRFVRLCNETVARYHDVLAEYVSRGDNIVDLGGAVDRLLGEAGLTRTPSVPVLAYHTAAAHLSELLPESRWPEVMIRTKESVEKL